MVLKVPVVLPAPSVTTSRYVRTLNREVLYDQGCSQGRAKQSGIIVLDFGAPRFRDSTYGTTLFGAGGFATTTQIADAAKAFLQGYWDCSPSGAYIRLAIGTSNCGNGSGPDLCNPGGGNVTREHGRAWQQMVGAVADWINGQPGYASKLSVAGASDMEPGWNSASDTRAWVDGYFSTSNKLYALYNYGSCDGCPYFNRPSSKPPNGWTLEDIWYISYGARLAYPIPEIYHRGGIQADQWARMSLYAYNKHGRKMYFRGVFSQWSACQGDSLGAIQCRKYQLDNTPDAAWTQLNNALNKDPKTAQALLRWATDVTWQR
jgi:hypothetical protein